MSQCPCKTKFVIDPAVIAQIIADQGVVNSISTFDVDTAEDGTVTISHTGGDGAAPTTVQIAPCCFVTEPGTAIEDLPDPAGASGITYDTAGNIVAVWDPAAGEWVAPSCPVSACATGPNGEVVFSNSVNGVVTYTLADGTVWQGDPGDLI